MTGNPLEEAKRLVRAAGYYCIPRERLQVLESSKFVSYTELYRVGNDESLKQHVRRSMFLSLADGLADKGVCEFLEGPSDTRGYHEGKVYRTRLKVVPFQIELDPFVTMMREQEAKA